MDNASEAILALKPVTFHYKKDRTANAAIWFDRRGSGQSESRPGRSRAKGEIYTVRYDAVNAMLLNEFLKEHRKIEDTGSDHRKLKQMERNCEHELSAHCDCERAGSANPKGERPA